MPVVPVFNMEGQQVGEMALRDEIWAVPLRRALIHQAVLAHLANRRQGTHSTKTRGEVSGGGRKPWRQKGTGRARQGSIRSPLWRHGGIVFGPKPRVYGFPIPRKARRLALKSALSAKLRDGQVVVLEQLRLSEPKTRAMVSVLEGLKVKGQKALIIMGEKDPNVFLAARNIPGVALLPPDALGVYPVVDADRVVLTKDAVAALEEALG
ncbi:MAG: 50S ribosomal protein L4 [Firmicutes bacterium]|nr:50S ribosomal protein L4 [Bacillota bacterium]